MLSNFGTLLKDFIIYVIPGSLIYFSGLQIIGSLEAYVAAIKDNNSLAILSVFLCFIIGFVFSQLQIILFWRFHKERRAKMIEASILDRNIVIAEVCKVLKIDEITIKDKEDLDSYLVNICYNYVKIRGNNETAAAVERDSYLSSFSISIYLPIILSIIGFLEKSNWTYLHISIATIFISILLFFLTQKVAINFRKGRITRIFLQFLIFTANPNIKIEDKKP